MTGATPRVSVVLPVRNGGPYLHAAVASILGQTLADLELIVIDDGSTDDSRAIVRAFGDERIRLVEQEPRGLVTSLNHGLELARAPLVARMDADDVSLPERLARQAALLEARPEVGLVCTAFSVVDATGAALGRTLLPLHDHELRMRLLLRNPFSHGAVMTRRSVLDAVGPYSDVYGNNEDYDLWRRIAARYELAALEDVLYAYREHAAGVSKTTAEDRVRRREALRSELWRDLAGAYRARRVVASVRSYRDGTADGATRAHDLLDDQWALAREAMLRRRPWIAVRALSVAAVLQPRPPGRVLARLKRLRG